MPRDARAYLRDIVGFRNQFTHAYPSVNDGLVWGIAVRDLPVLSDECRRLFDDVEAGGESS